MDTTRYAKPRPCLPSLQRARVGRARAVSLDEVSDRSLSRDDLVWETRMCLQPSTAPSIDERAALRESYPTPRKSYLSPTCI